MNDWNQNYEKLTDMIVPRSSQLITSDADYALFTVTLFKKVAAEFKHHARERKLVFLVEDLFFSQPCKILSKHSVNVTQIHYLSPFLQITS